MAPRGDRAPLGPQEKIPFAVVGADQEHQVNGRRVLGRKTKWGIIEGKGGQGGLGCQQGVLEGSSTPGCTHACSPRGVGLCPRSSGPHPTQEVPTACSVLPCSGEPDALRVPHAAGPAHPVSWGMGLGVPSALLEHPRLRLGGGGHPQPQGAACDGDLVPFLLAAPPGRSHLQDLKDITHNVHYESYRVRRLNESNRVALSPANGLPGKDEDDSNL